MRIKYFNEHFTIRGQAGNNNCAFCRYTPNSFYCFLCYMHLYFTPNRETFSLPPIAVLSATGLINQGLLCHHRLETLAGTEGQGCRTGLQEKEIWIEQLTPRWLPGYSSGFSESSWRYFGITEQEEVGFLHNNRAVNIPSYMAKD